jgi:predicted RNase H-like HicB family nuclease
MPPLDSAGQRGEDRRSNPERNVMNRHFTAIIEREGDGYVGLCPELDVASQGTTVAETRANLQEAIELFLETASPTEIERRLTGEVYITQIEVAVG